tara:strand:+ start:2130 stop:2588 length:459 start_codon:yes stop_codon:yes gene_type:complete
MVPYNGRMKDIHRNLTLDDLAPQLLREVAFTGDFVALGIILGQGLSESSAPIREAADALTFKIYSQAMAQGLDISTFPVDELPDPVNCNFVLLGAEVENLRAFASAILDGARNEQAQAELRQVLDRVMDPMWEAYCEPPETETRSFDRVNLN